MQGCFGAAEFHVERRAAIKLARQTQMARYRMGANELASRPKTQMRLLYHCPFGTGGLAAYAHEQANELCQTGCMVTLATSADYVHHGIAHYEIVRLYPAPARSRGSLPRWLRRLGTALKLLHEQFRLAAYAARGDFRCVLMGSYIEYLAPLWAWRFRQMARRGTVFGAVVHDPVRDFVVGPRWWHRWSIAAGFSFIREAFVHSPIVLETVRPMPQLRTTVVPHGPYKYPPSNRSRTTIRNELALPADAKVLLAFGHIRDGKNLHLVIEAMVKFPALYLIVAGRPQSESSKPGAYYQDVARRCEVAARCRWLLDYIPDEDVSGLFEASDIVLLTYSRSFHSASGVLNTALSFRKPIIASSGDGTLKDQVQHYRLGIWVEPDDSNAICEGLSAVLTRPINPDWAGYERDNSWSANAALVCACMGAKPR